MFNSATQENRVVTTALTVTYETERHYETLADGTLRYWWMVTRKASKDYRFINMTEKAVILAAAAKVEQYTRETRKCVSRTLDKVCPSLTTSVQPEFNDCGSWDLVINVSETDSTHSDTLPADPAALFAEENTRDYDEGESGIIDLMAFYGQNISFGTKGFTESQIRNGLNVETLHEGKEWVRMPREEIDINISETAFVNLNPSSSAWSLTAAGDLLRVMIGSVVSSEVVIQPGV